MWWAAGSRTCCDATLHAKGRAEVSEERKGRRIPPPEEAVGGSAEVAAPASGAAPAAAGSASPGDAGPADAPEDAAVLKDRWLRAEAELQNYRRRAAREREEARRGAEEGVMLEIIAALDDLDRALAMAPESGAPEPWAEGVRHGGRPARRLPRAPGRGRAGPGGAALRSGLPRGRPRDGGPRAWSPAT